MQPYFLPYIGYFILIRESDKFIFFDTVQYQRRSWMNRNRILSLDKDFTYIKLPINKAPQTTAIKDISIDYKQDWKNKILSQIEIYKKIAPNYKEVRDFLEDSLLYETDSLLEMNIHLIKRVCDYLDIRQNSEVFSKMSLDIPNDLEPDEWALNVCQAVGAKEYINAPGGISFFDKTKYIVNGIDIKFIKANLQHYYQGKKQFEAGLSIIDIMMFNSIDCIKDMMNDYEVL